MKNKIYNDLFNQIRTVTQKSEEISKLKKESFNIFSILRKEHEEEKLHSAFLTELLNINGSHEMGPTFLNLFINQFKITGFHVDDTIDVKAEKSVAQFGRIDIHIRNQQNEIIVLENKIYAEDQPKQLVRYYQYLKQQTTTEKSNLIYLTLNGVDASNYSAFSKEENILLSTGNDYITLSYRSDIITWLDSCLKEATDHPTLRETIKQYIILLKKLTNQLTVQTMDNEIKNIISQNYLEAKTIEENVWKAELEATKVLFESIQQLVSERLGDKWDIILDNDLTKHWTGIKIRHSSWDENIFIILQGQSKAPWSKSIYGITANHDVFDRVDLLKRLELTDILKEEFSDSVSCPIYAEIFNFETNHLRAQLFDIATKNKIAIDSSEKLVDLSLACKDMLVNLKTI